MTTYTQKVEQATRKEGRTILQILCLREEGTGAEETYRHDILLRLKFVSTMSLHPSVEDLHHMTEPHLVDDSQHQQLQIQDDLKKDAKDLFRYMVQLKICFT